MNFAVDAPVSPGRVLFGEADDQRSDLGVDGWTTRPSDLGWVQCRATRRRCRPITVSGFTIRKTSASRRRSSALESIVRSVRSVSLNCGRVICRCKTVTWWRRARISASRSSPVAKTHPPEPGENKSCEGHEEEHRGGNVSTPTWAQTPRIRVPMSIRHQPRVAPRALSPHRRRARWPPPLPRACHGSHGPGSVSRLFLG